MTPEYHFFARAPFTDVAALEYAAAAIGLPIVPDEDGDPSIRQDSLLAFPAALDDADRRGIRNSFGVDANVGLVFLDLSNVDAEMFHVVRWILRATTSFRADKSVHGVLLEEFENDRIILEVAGGEVTLNSLWNGWEEWPEVRGAVAEPYRRAAIRLRDSGE